MGAYAVSTIFGQLTLGMNAFVTSQGFTQISMISVIVGSVFSAIMIRSLKPHGYIYMSTKQPYIIAVTGQNIYKSPDPNKKGRDFVQKKINKHIRQ